MDLQIIAGIVTKSTGSWYAVRLPNNQIVQARIKGKFRLEGIKHTNPIAVGDEVTIQFEADQETAVITQIHPRKNYIIRKASNLSKQTHILASNIDQALLVASLVQPQTSLGFIDRFLATAEAYHIPAVLVINKVDLHESSLNEYALQLTQLYAKLGYDTLLCSAKSGIGLASLKTLLANKTTLISGHSGVGKSTLLNAIEPSLNLKTGSISAYSNKGKHTTTFAEMFPLSFGGYIIDTPGIKELGVVDFEPRLVSHYFREMKALVGQCKFNNCVHEKEPGCAVLEAVHQGSINLDRYNNYLSILHNEDLFA